MKPQTPPKISYKKLTITLAVLTLVVIGLMVVQAYKQNEADKDAICQGLSATHVHIDCSNITKICGDFCLGKDGKLILSNKFK